MASAIVGWKYRYSLSCWLGVGPSRFLRLSSIGGRALVVLVFTCLKSQVLRGCWRNGGNDVVYFILTEKGKRGRVGLFIGW